MEKISKLLEELSNLVEYYIGSSSRKTTIILGSSITFILISYWVKKYIERRGFFKRINLPSPKPLPLFGNFLDIIRNGLIQNDIKHVKTYGRISGFFEGSTPVIIVTDLRFLKTMMIKDFSSFVNRRVIDSFAIDPFDKFLTNLKDDEWKNVRSVLTATFTSGKLKSVLFGFSVEIKLYDF